MKNKVLFFSLIGIGLTVAADASAKDVYVYTPAGEALETATGIRRIEFVDGKMALVPESGEKIDIDLSQMGYFAFKPVGSDGVSSAESMNAIVNLSGDVLSVTSASEISEIRIYNVLGEMTGYYAPSACTATMTVNTRGLSIVVVEAGGKSQTYKIVR